MEDGAMRKNSIRLVTLAFVALGLAVGGVATAATTETFVPTTIQYPGSSSTAARGINNSGEIVGTYSCSVAAGCTLAGEEGTPGSHGFLLKDGFYTRIDVPGGTNTVARGISDQGTIIGHYNAAGVTHGFAYSDGKYYSIDVPAELFDNPGTDARHTLAVRISPQGDIVGCIHEANLQMTTMHGWLWRNGRFTILLTPHYPGDTTSDPDTMNNGISPSGEIVGFYGSSGESYVADRTGIRFKFTFDGGRFTLAWDVNARGDIVGVVGENQANTVGGPVNARGFLRNKHGDYRILEVQSASITQVFGINARREIVGLYIDATGTHGFVYRVEH
jgi:probable HAF family extracellular repeat protein